MLFILFIYSVHPFVHSFILNHGFRILAIIISARKKEDFTELITSYYHVSGLCVCCNIKVKGGRTLANNAIATNLCKGNSVRYINVVYQMHVAYFFCLANIY